MLKRMGPKRRRCLAKRNPWTKPRKCSAIMCTVASPNIALLFRWRMKHLAVLDFAEVPYFSGSLTKKLLSSYMGYLVAYSLPAMHISMGPLQRSKRDFEFLQKHLVRIFLLLLTWLLTVDHLIPIKVTDRRLKVGIII